MKTFKELTENISPAEKKFITAFHKWMELSTKLEILYKRAGGSDDINFDDAIETMGILNQEIDPD